MPDAGIGGKSRWMRRYAKTHLNREPHKARIFVRREGLVWACKACFVEDWRKKNGRSGPVDWTEYNGPKKT